MKHGTGLRLGFIYVICEKNSNTIIKHKTSTCFEWFFNNCYSCFKCL